jgi:hypothetical protein
MTCLDRLSIARLSLRQYLFLATLEDDLRGLRRIIDELDSGLNPKAERVAPKAKRSSGRKKKDAK